MASLAQNNQVDFPIIARVAIYVVDSQHYFRTGDWMIAAVRSSTQLAFPAGLLPQQPGNPVPVLWIQLLSFWLNRHLLLPSLLLLGVKT